MLTRSLRIFFCLILLVGGGPILAGRGPTDQGGGPITDHGTRPYVSSADDESVTQLGTAPTTPEMSTRQLQCALDKAKAFHAANKASQQLSDVIVLIDYDAPTNTQRMTIVNLVTGTVKKHTVAHGRGGIDTKINSGGSELGFMRFAETYHGKHGLSVRIDGLEPDNKDVRERDIVLHGADYVREGGNAGRSLGCPAVDHKSIPEIVRQVQNGALLFSYRGGDVCGQFGPQ